MITFKRVSKRYESGQVALQDIDLHIPKGEMVFVTGHSGAGKTSLLNLIALQKRHSRGQLLVNDVNYQHLRASQIPLIRRRIGLIFQDPNLIHERTVFENIALPLVISGFRHQEISRRVRAALDKVGLTSKEKSYPVALSSGEQQRVSIARAIVHKPLILLADEPTGNLDPELSGEIMNLLLEFNRVGMTQLIASHDLQLITRYDRPMITLHKGRML